jgi:hypothetical protein
LGSRVCARDRLRIPDASAKKVGASKPCQENRETNTQKRYEGGAEAAIILISRYPKVVTVATTTAIKSSKSDSYFGRRGRLRCSPNMVRGHAIKRGPTSTDTLT